jgi:hypothetical protein
LLRSLAKGFMGVALKAASSWPAIWVAWRASSVLVVMVRDRNVALEISMSREVETTDGAR